MTTLFLHTKEGKNQKTKRSVCGSPFKPVIIKNDAANLMVFALQPGLKVIRGGKGN